MSDYEPDSGRNPLERIEEAYRIIELAERKLALGLFEDSEPWEIEGCISPLQSKIDEHIALKQYSMLVELRDRLWTKVLGLMDMVDEAKLNGNHSDVMEFARQAMSAVEIVKMIDNDIDSILGKEYGEVDETDT